MTQFKNGTIVPIPPLERHVMTENTPNRHVPAYEVRRDDNVVIKVKGHRRIGKVWAVLPTKRKSTDYIDVLFYPQGHRQHVITLHKTKDTVEIYE